MRKSLYDVCYQEMLEDGKWKVLKAIVYDKETFEKWRSKRQWFDKYGYDNQLYRLAEKLANKLTPIIYNEQLVIEMGKDRKYRLINRVRRGIEVMGLYWLNEEHEED